MIIELEKDLPKLLGSLVPAGFIPPRKRVLVVPPSYYKIEYAINDFMRKPDGSLNEVDPELALSQWEALVQVYEDLGLSVEEIKPDPKCPDMVYSANHGLPYWDYMSEKPAVVMAKMANAERSAEVAHFKAWYEKEGYVVQELSPAISRFEGMGDAFVDPTRLMFWGGYGTRSQKEAYDEIADLTGYSVVLLPLKSATFYHLDTCFGILNSQTAVVVREAFSSDSLKIMSALFANLIEIPSELNKKHFLANCFCPNGTDVVVQKGAPLFVEQLKKVGLNVHELDTGEFLKGGGSVFCMKMAVY